MVGKVTVDPAVVLKGTPAATSCDDPESAAEAAVEEKDTSGQERGQKRDGVSTADDDIAPLASLPKGTRQRRRRQIDALSCALASVHISAARALAKNFSLRRRPP